MNFIKKNIKYIGIIMICIFCSYLTTIATNYAFDSSDVRFDNTGTDLDSVNVQDALDETFHHVTDYNEIKTTIGNGSLTTTSQNIIGAVNEINDHVANLPNYTTCNALSNVETYLSSVASGLSDGQIQTIYIVTGTNFDSSAFGKGERYSGKLTRMTSTQFVCTLASRLGDSVDIGYYNGTFKYNNLSDQIVPLLKTTKRFEGNSTQRIDSFGNYNIAICALYVENVGTSIISIQTVGAVANIVHIAGTQNATNAISGSISNGTLTLTASNKFTISFINATMNY